jgi:hypothetical protein
VKYRKLSIKAVIAVEDDADDGEAQGRAYLEVMLLLKTMATRSFLRRDPADQLIGMDFPVVWFDSRSEDTQWPPAPVKARQAATAPSFGRFLSWLEGRGYSDRDWKYIGREHDLSGFPPGTELHVIDGFPHSLEFSRESLTELTVTWELP